MADGGEPYPLARYPVEPMSPVIPVELKLNIVFVT